MSIGHVPKSLEKNPELASDKFLTTMDHKNLRERDCILQHIFPILYHLYILFA
jgi:hypothetical protein